MLKTSRWITPFTMKTECLQRRPSKYLGNSVTQQTVPILELHILLPLCLPTRSPSWVSFSSSLAVKVSKIFPKQNGGEQALQKRPTKHTWSLAVPKCILLQGRKSLLLLKFAIFSQTRLLFHLVIPALFVAMLYPVLMQFHFPSSCSNRAHPGTAPLQRLL